jgi:hypothetical protein
MVAAIVTPALLWPAAGAQQAHHPPRVERLINQAERLAFVLRQRQVRLGQAEALAQGLARNPDLGGAYQAIEGRAWTLIATRRSWFPSLQVLGSTNALRSSEPMLIGQTLTLTDSSKGSSGRTLDTTAGPGVVLNWSFFDARRPAAINQTLESLKAERFLFDIADNDGVTAGNQQGLFTVKTVVTSAFAAVSDATLTAGAKKKIATATFGAAAGKKVAFVLENASGVTKTYYRKANASGVAKYTIALNGTWTVYATFGDEITDTVTLRK